jgi:hypothetical protein
MVEYVALSNPLATSFSRKNTGFIHSKKEISVSTSDVCFLRPFLLAAI